MANDIERSAASETHSPLHIRYPPGELIYRAKTYAAGIYVIVSGLVNDHNPMQTTSKRPPVLELLGPGDVIGLDALLEPPGCLHLSSARAVTEVVLHFFEREVFLQILNDDPALCRRCLDYLNHRFHTCKQSALLPIPASLEERLCRLFLNLAERFGELQDDGNVLLPEGISCEHLPELLGVSSRRVRRALTCLPKVQQAKNRLIISTEALRQWLAEGCRSTRVSD